MPSKLLYWPLLIVASCGSTVPTENEAQSTQSHAPEGGQLIVNADGTAHVSGTVLENNQGCMRDLMCYLRLVAGQEEVYVYYNEGEGTPCINAAAAAAGFEARVGDWVQVYGEYGREGLTHALTICPDISYTIARQPGGSAAIDR